MAILAVWALLLTAPVSAAAPAITHAAAVCTAAAPGVVVKLGDASLEEYRQGDPARRVQLTRGNESAHAKCVNEGG